MEEMSKDRMPYASVSGAYQTQSSVSHPLLCAGCARASGHATKIHEQTCKVPISWGKNVSGCALLRVYVQVVHPDPEQALWGFRHAPCFRESALWSIVIAVRFLRGFL
jgi:hypothetical protein